MAIFRRRFSVYLTAIYEVTNVPKYMYNTTIAYKGRIHPLDIYDKKELKGYIKC